MPTKKSAASERKMLSAKLKADGFRLPHGYEIVMRKKRKPAKKKAAPKKATARKKRK